MKSILKVGLGLALAASLTGCQSPPSAPPVRMTGDPVTDGEAMLTITPERDKVLLEYKTALIAMRLGRFDDAKRLLDAAIARIGGIYGRDKSAEQSRGVFHSEFKKTFIGEPYERVMAYNYRGILYWMDGEPDNARACFRSAEIMDSYAEDQQYASDYMLLDYLDALATVKLGGDGSDAFKLAQNLAKGRPLPPLDPKANVLIFLDFGLGPTKYSTGRYNEELRFAPGNSPVQSAAIRVETFAEDIFPYDDLYFQATTRGGRAMDCILAGKARWKEGTEIGGAAAIVAGAVLAEDRHTQTAGLALLGAGVLTEIVSGAMKPAADTRCWDNLPQYISFAPLRMQPGPHTLFVDFKDRTGSVIPGMTKTINFTVPANGSDKIIFVSDQSAPVLNL